MPVYEFTVLRQPDDESFHSPGSAHLSASIALKPIETLWFPTHPGTCGNRDVNAKAAPLGQDVAPNSGTSGRK